MTVYVNGTPVRLHAGMTVKHALIAYDMETYEGALTGKIDVRDSRGFRVGLEGAVRDGARLTARPRPADSGEA